MAAALRRLKTWKPGTALVLVAIVTIGAGLRFWELGRLSFWYDEVVTMRLAEADGPRGLFARLIEIDATRAPLHPLLLQAWIGLFGSSEAAARGLSVVCGLATVGLVHQLASRAFDSTTGLWAAWLAAISPLLVFYSREVRMYALLVLLTTVSWSRLFTLRECRSGRRLAAYSLSLAALVYAHPLGLIMASTLGLASLVFLPVFLGNLRRWLAVHLVAALLAAPWLPRYFDHAPEYLSGRLPIRFLLGTPIGFLGGNFAILAVIGLFVAHGLARECLDRDSLGRLRLNLERMAVPACLLLWLIVPPTVLYVYSLVGSPVFGPGRYTLYVAPAYLILMALGLTRYPKWVGAVMGLAITGIAAVAIGPMVYDHDIKADWRGFAVMVRQRHASRLDPPAVILVSSTNPHRANVEVEAARYYLSEDRVAILPMEDVTRERLCEMRGKRVYLVFGTHRLTIRTPIVVPERFRALPLERIVGFPGMEVYGFLATGGSS